jgi:hypothetical protein
MTNCATAALLQATSLDAKFLLMAACYLAFHPSMATSRFVFGSG